nr:MAG TPA: hypothetical protein [Caudoviricetes sp.]
MVKINGEQTQNQFHEITPHSFNTINTIVSKPPKPIEPLVEEAFFILITSFLFFYSRILHQYLIFVNIIFRHLTSK